MLKFKKDKAISSSVIAAFLFLIGCIIAFIYFAGQKELFQILNSGMVENTIEYASTLQ